MHRKDGLSTKDVDLLRFLKAGEREPHDDLILETLKKFERRLEFEKKNERRALTTEDFQAQGFYNFIMEEKWEHFGGI
jgi:hypothetical protein